MHSLMSLAYGCLMFCSLQDSIYEGETERLKVSWAKLVVFTAELSEHPLNNPELMRIGDLVFEAIFHNVSVQLV